MPFDPISYNLASKSYNLASKKIPPVLKDLDMNGLQIKNLGGLELPKTLEDDEALFPNRPGGFIAWDYPPGTGATVFFNHHGGGGTEYIFYSTTDWSDFIELLEITNSIAQFDVHILPRADDIYNIGSSRLRWANLYAVNVYTGDLNFEEKVCEVCGRPFLKDDELVLKVKEVDDYTRTVPVHLKCSQAYKELDERLKLLEEKVGR